MNEPGIAPTKVQPPRLRVGLVERPVLQARLLQAVSDCQMVLLAAPAGFGKTAALASLLPHLPPGTALAWVSADADDDMARLLDCLVAALEPHDVPWPVDPQSLAAQAALDERGCAQAARTVAAALDATDAVRGLIVIDDVHAVRDERVFRFIEQLVAALPAHWCLVLSGRREPPLALARLRLLGVVATFDHHALRFDAGEAEALVRSVMPQADAAVAAQLLERTGGWAAALRLCLMAPARDDAAQAAPSGANRRHLFDYLASEVYEQMPEPLRGFVLRCSVLPELDVERCRQLTGEPRSAALLDELDSRGLFVSALDGPQLTLRLHDLFRDFLRVRLRRELPDELPALLQRAAAGENDPVRRLRLLVDAQAWDEAEAVLQQAARALLVSQGTEQVLHLLDLFPTERQERSAWLPYWRAMASRARLDHLSVRQHLRTAIRRFGAAGCADDAARARAHLAMALYFLGEGHEAEQQLAWARASSSDAEMLAVATFVDFWLCNATPPPRGAAYQLELLADHLDQTDDPFIWLQCTRTLPAVAGRPGLAPALQRILAGARRIAGDSHPLLLLNAQIVEAGQLLWRGQLDEAAPLIERAAEDGRWLGQPQTVERPLLRFRIAQAAFRGDREAAEAAAGAFLDYVSKHVLSHWSAQYDFAFCGLLAASAEAWEAVRESLRLLAAREALQPAGPMPASLVHTVLRARLALHEGRADPLPSIEQVAEQLGADEWPLSTGAAVRVVLALTQARSGNLDRAWQLLQPLAPVMEAPDARGALLMAGRSCLGELARLPWRAAGLPAAADVCRRWQLLAGDGAQAVAPAAAPLPTRALSSLSPRERQVLQRLAIGDSNKQIARTFDLSAHTVKRHVARLLAHLEVHSRVEAARWYRDQAGELP